MRAYYELEVSSRLYNIIYSSSNYDCIMKESYFDNLVSLNTSNFIQLLSETLEISTFNDIAVGDYLNLEWSLTPSSKMGGHIVSGHVDDVGVIEEISWGEKWGTLVIEFDEKWKNNIKILVPPVRTELTLPCKNGILNVECLF